MPSALVWDPLEAEPETCSEQLGRAGSQQRAAMKPPPTVGTVGMRAAKEDHPIQGAGELGYLYPTLSVVG